MSRRMKLWVEVLYPSRQIQVNQVLTRKILHPQLAYPLLDDFRSLLALLRKRNKSNDDRSRLWIFQLMAIPCRKESFAKNENALLPSVYVQISPICTGHYYPGITIMLDRSLQEKKFNFSTSLIGSTPMNTTLEFSSLSYWWSVGHNSSNPRRRNKTVIHAKWNLVSFPMIGLILIYRSLRVLEETGIWRRLTLYFYDSSTSRNAQWPKSKAIERYPAEFSLLFDVTLKMALEIQVCRLQRYGKSAKFSGIYTYLFAYENAF